MDTKSKNSKKTRRTVCFALSFILCIASFIGFLSTIIYLEHYFNRSNINANDVYHQNSYLDSSTLSYDLGNAAFEAEVAARNKVSEKENSPVKSNGTEVTIEREKTDKNTYFYFVQIGNELIQTNGSSSVKDYKSAVSYANNMKAYYTWADGEMSTKPNESWVYYSFSDDERVVIGFPDEYFTQKEVVYKNQLSNVASIFLFLFACAAIALITFIVSLITVGRRNPDGTMKINWFDKIFTEIQIVACGFAFVIGGAFFLDMCYDAFDSYYNSVQLSPIIRPFPLAVSLSVGVIAAFVGFSFFLSMVKNLKAKRFMRNFLVLKPFYSLKNFSFQWKDINRSILSLVIGIALCSMGLTMFILVIFQYAYWSIFRLLILAIFVLLVTTIPFYLLLQPHIKKYRQIAEGVQIVQNGNLEYKIPISGNTPLNDLADGINKISDGYHIAIDNEVKSERMKTELISNVSHDIKTPLTSMITYVDLLKREGVDCEDAPKYLQILEEKTMRLKKLTEDLFEAAKASSGNIKTQIETVELTSLIQQALGEMDTKLREKGLEIIVSGKKNKYYVYADGQLMWRVFENLLGNLVKYAQDNSRVYIDLDEISRRVSDDNGSDIKLMAVVVIKNISKYQLNISSAELMERFTRGDESRSTDGSGLGLSIAKDLMLIQQGDFDIQIDGDLFKAILYIPAVKEMEDLENSTTQKVEVVSNDQESIIEKDEINPTDETVQMPIDLEELLEEKTEE